MGGRLAITLAVGLPLWPAASRSTTTSERRMPLVHGWSLGRRSCQLAHGPQQLQTMPAQRVSASRVPRITGDEGRRPLEGGRHPTLHPQASDGTYSYKRPRYRWRSLRDAAKGLHPVPSGMSPSAASRPASIQPSDFANGIRPLFRSLLRQERLHGDNAPPAVGPRGDGKLYQWPMTARGPANSETKSREVFSAPSSD